MMLICMELADLAELASRDSSQWHGNAQDLGELQSFAVLALLVGQVPPS